VDAAGKDVVFVETVGVGQTEVEVVGIVDTVVLVLMPGAGDSVQALKAGIMEIPDVIVVNKADDPGARIVQRDVRSVLSLDPTRTRTPAVVLTETVHDEGVAVLWDAVEAHRAELEGSGELERRRSEQLAAEVYALAARAARSHLERTVSADPELAEILTAVQGRELDPLSAARALNDRVLGIEQVAPD
jgi:LAO/AO transport system kinase